MKRIDLTPEAVSDLQSRKSYLDDMFGEKRSKKIISKIMDTIENLLLFPDTGLSLYDKYGIECDYCFIIAHKNYVFFRKEGETIKVIRILDERQDFISVLFGITTNVSDAEENMDEW